MEARDEAFIDAAAVHAAMPMGLALVDTTGTIREVNAQTLHMLGLDSTEVVGRSVLDFVYPDDLEFAADVLRDGEHFIGQLAGPVRIRYVDAHGRIRSTELWSRPCRGVGGVDGFVVTMSEESTVVQMSAAIRSTVSGATLDESLTHLTSALAAHPIEGRAAVVLTDGDAARVVGDWPFGGLTVGPWQLAASLERPIDAELIGAPHDPEFTTVTVPDNGHAPIQIEMAVPEEVRSSAADQGITTVWCRPVPTGDVETTAVLVVARRRSGAPSLNQRRHLDDGVAVVALALDQVAHRKEIERAVYIDALTGVGNRARFEKIVANAQGMPMGILYIDLDGFKAVNDRLGHSTGDEILGHVASRLQGAVRQRDEVLRMGGDEFVVLCKGASTFDGLETLAERLTSVLSQPYRLERENPVHLSASIGIDLGEAEASLRHVLERADEAMYAAKAAGKGTWRRAGGHHSSE